MQIRNKGCLIYAFVLAVLFSGTASAQQIDPNQFYRMTTQWQGSGKSLDIVNDGRNNNQLQLTKTGNYTGQYWKFTPGQGGYYRLTTQWQGTAKSLDVVNDGRNNRLQLANTGNFSGQYWKLTPVDLTDATPHRAGSSSAADYKNVKGSRGQCSAGFRLVTVKEATDNIAAACNAIGQWDIVRLAHGSSISGSGYDCKVLAIDNRGMGSSLCRAGSSMTFWTGNSRPNSLGCFKDQGDPTGTGGRDLSGFVYNNNHMTTGSCISTCKSKGFAYAGTQFSNWCFCGNTYGKSGRANNCNMPCSGDNIETCGGSWANSVYQLR